MVDTFQLISLFSEIRDETTISQKPKNTRLNEMSKILLHALESKYFDRISYTLNLSSVEKNQGPFRCEFRISYFKDSPKIDTSLKKKNNNNKNYLYKQIKKHSFREIQNMDVYYYAVYYYYTVSASHNFMSRLVLLMHIK